MQPEGGFVEQAEEIGEVGGERGGGGGDVDGGGHCKWGRPLSFGRLSNTGCRYTRVRVLKILPSTINFVSDIDSTVQSLPALQSGFYENGTLKGVSYYVVSECTAGDRRVRIRHRSKLEISK